MKNYPLFRARRWLSTCTLALAAVGSLTQLPAAHNYPEVLQKSLFFYEAQRAGPLPADNRVTWRGDSGLADGAEVGLNLTGGWYDAGDNIKFNFPMASTVTALCWGYLENPTAFSTYQQKQHFLKNIRWVTDYFIRCHSAPNVLYGQVSNGTDHSFWVSCEVIHLHMARPSYRIDATKPGSDLAGETAAALAAASMVFATEDPAYSATLLTHAQQLYTFADTYRGKYSTSIPQAADFYNSWSGYQDELVWGAIWLYRATQNSAYLTKAATEYENLNKENQTPYRSYGWTIAWDDKSYGCYVLMAKLTGEQKYHDDAQRYLDEWFVEKAGRPGPNFTPAGFPILDQWGSNRYAANTAFLLQVYSDIAPTAALKTKYYNRAKSIIDYILGDNPQDTSYVIGYGARSPKNPHHRTAHGSWLRSESIPVQSRHTLYGALVGGHSTTSDTDWVDDRSNYVKNEVATDYNSFFTGAVARLAKDFGGTIEANFPQPEVPVGEFVTQARINSNAATFTEVAVYGYNRTSWPARTARLSFRYFVDISEGVARGYGPTSYTVSVNFGNATATPLQAWDAANNIYYTEVTFSPAVPIFPGGQSECYEEAQLRIALPAAAPAGAWSPLNDPSFAGLGNSLIDQPTIPLYDNGALVYGSEPPRGLGITADFSATPDDGYAPLTVAFDASTTVNTTGTPATYAWNFGDTTTGTGRTPTHLFATPGSYSVKLTATAGAASSMKTKTVTVRDSSPVAVATATPIIGEAPLAVSFTGSGSLSPISLPLTYAWNFGDTTPGATTANATHTYTTPGLYTATLTVSDGTRTDSESVTISVTPVAPPAIVIAPTTIDVLQGSTASVGVKLSRAPSGPVSLTVARAAGTTDLTVSAGGTLTFTTADWNVAKNVIISAGSAAPNATATFNVSGAGVASASFVATEKPVSTGLTATYALSNDWGSGFVSNISLVNGNTTSTNGWTITIVFSKDFTLVNSWNGNFTKTGNTLTITNLGWNQVLAANGGSTSLGFQATYSSGGGAPTVVSISAQ